VIRKALGDDGAAHALALEVNLGDEVDLALLGDIEARLAARELDLAGAQDDLGGRGEKDGVGQAVIPVAAARA